MQTLKTSHLNGFLLLLISKKVRITTCCSFCFLSVRENDLDLSLQNGSRGREALAENRRRAEGSGESDCQHWNKQAKDHNIPVVSAVLLCAGLKIYGWISNRRYICIIINILYILIDKKKKNISSFHSLILVFVVDVARLSLITYVSILFIDR